MFQDDDDDTPPGVEDDLRVQVDAMRERYESQGVEDDLRRIGCYVDPHDVQFIPFPTPFGVKMAMVLVGNIGDLAWSERVQNPEQYSVDAELRQMTQGLRADDFLDQRQRIADRIEAGLDPFGEDDDADSA